MMKAIIDAWRAADRWPGWLRTLAGGWAWFAVLPLFGLTLSYRPLVLATQGGFDTLLVLLCALVSAATSPLWFRLKEARTKSGRDLRRFAFVMLMPLLSALLGYSVATVGLPAGTALVTGERLAFVATVNSLGDSASRSCRRPVLLDGMVWPFDRLCRRLDPDQAGRPDWLAPGATVVVSGRGHGRLLLPDRIAPVDGASADLNGRAAIAGAR